MNNAIKSRTLKLVITAVMTALTCVVTVYVNIPNGVGGNINIGDSLIFISASLLGALPAAFIGGIGSMIADFVGGYAAFAPFTLIVKGLEGLVAGLVSYYAFNLESKNRLSGIARILLTIGGMIAAALVMTLGYFVTSLILNNGMIKTALTESSVASFYAPEREGMSQRKEPVPRDSLTADMTKNICCGEEGREYTQ